MHWYALYTNPRAEKKVCTQLNKLDTEAYLPLLKHRKKWSDRFKWVEEPLFPSYVFVRLREEKADFLRVLRIPHVVRFVSFENSPAVIPDADISILRLSLENFANSINVVSTEEIRIGDKILVTEGPFRGREAIIDAKHKNATVLVVFPALNKSLQVAVPLTHIQRAAI